MGAIFRQKFFAVTNIRVKKFGVEKIGVKMWSHI